MVIFDLYSFKICLCHSKEHLDTIAAFLSYQDGNDRWGK